MMLLGNSMQLAADIRVATPDKVSATDYKFSLDKFSLSLPTAFFRSCRGLFRGTFCNFVANLRWHKPIKTETIIEKSNISFFRPTI